MSDYDVDQIISLSRDYCEAVLRADRLEAELAEAHRIIRNLIIDDSALPSKRGPTGSRSRPKPRNNLGSAPGCRLSDLISLSCRTFIWESGPRSGASSLLGARSSRLQSVWTSDAE